MSYCLHFHFTKSLNPISFIILIHHSLLPSRLISWFLTLALYLSCIVILTMGSSVHLHFTPPFLFYGLTLIVSLNKLSYSCSAFCWHFKSSSFTFYSLHLISYHFIFSSSSHLFYEEIAIAIAKNSFIEAIVQGGLNRKLNLQIKFKLWCCS
jgi:hypothetical protein